MLKISIFDTSSHRRLVVEGKLIAPWAAELSTAWRNATADLNGRELVIDVKCLTAIKGRRKRTSGADERRSQVSLFRCVHQAGPETARPRDTQKCPGGEEMTGNVRCRRHWRPGILAMAVPSCWVIPAAGQYPQVRRPQPQEEVPNDEDYSSRWQS
jgi:hypothetical protein